MRSVPFVIASVLALACDTPIQEPPQVGNPGFVLFGIVRNEAGTPLSGASVWVLDGAAHRRTAYSNLEGYFSLTGAWGPMTIVVLKDGYELYTEHLEVVADRAIQVTLHRQPGSDTLTLGETVTLVVLEDAPPCDPAGWDGRAPCRRLGFVAPVSGVLRVTIAWNGDPPLDATINLANGAYLAVSTESGFEQIAVSTSVGAGDTYEVRVSSYYGRQLFTLRAELTPFTGAGRMP